MGDIRISQALIDALRPAASSMGIELPASGAVVGRVCLDDPLRDLAYTIGQHVSNCGLYRVGGSRKLKARTVEGDWKEMTPEWFMGWIQEFLTVTKSYQSRGNTLYTETTMGKNMATAILAQDVFLSEIPIIEQFAPVRMPVKRADGRMELLKAGYDVESKVFCEDNLRYDLTMKNAEALSVFAEYFGEFPWAEIEDGKLWRNRSFLVHVSAMVGVYCRLLMPPSTVRPVIAYMANEQGSGKSMLVAAALAPVFGIASAADLPVINGKVDTSKLTVLLETVAQTVQPYFWLDDVPHSVVANSLNSFVTKPRHTGRKYGKNDEMFDVPNVTQVFITGNNVHVKRDFMQRALISELFSKVSSESRVPKFEMSAVWLSGDTVRARLLAALHCFFRDWAESGAEAGLTVKRRAVDWSRIVGGMLRASDIIDDPFEEPELPMSGDTETDEIRSLLCALADEAEEEFDYTTEQNETWRGYAINTQKVIDKARELGMLVGLVGLPDEKALKKGELISLGRKLESFRGKEDLVTKKGRRFRFGHRKQSSGTVYPLEWL